MNFNYYWQEIGRYHQEVIDNPKLEDTFKSFARKIYKEGERKSESGYQKGYEDGHNDCYDKYRPKSIE